jgi:hypothetical protein
MNLREVAEEISRRLSSIFTRAADGRRAVFGGADKFQSDPHWRDNVLFYEYFHADNGAGLGASHQTGWTGVVAKLIQMFGASAGPAGVPPTPARVTPVPPAKAPTSSRKPATRAKRGS